MDFGNIINVEVHLSCNKTTHKMPNSPTFQIQEHLVNVSAVNGCVNTFSLDIELRNDRIPRNPFYGQFRDMNCPV